MSNQAYLDTIDPETPHHADILILEDGIALAEDSLKLTILANDLRIQWQEKNLPELNLAKAVGDFCNPKILPDNPLAKELEGQELLQVKITKAMIDEMDFLAETRSSLVDVDKIEDEFRKKGYEPNLSYFTRLNSYVKKLGLETKDPFNIKKNKFVEQFDKTIKWRSRIRLEDVNEVIVRHTESKVAYDSWVQYLAKCSFIVLNTLGIAPQYFNFDIESEESVEELIFFTTTYQFFLDMTLGNEQQAEHRKQFETNQSLINIIGGLYYVGNQNWKDKLEEYVSLFIHDGPNFTYNKLISMGYSEEQTNKLIDEAHTWHFQRSYADQSALTVGAASLGKLFDRSNFSGMGHFFRFIDKPLQMLKDVINQHVLDDIVLSVNKIFSQSLFAQLQNELKLPDDSYTPKRNVLMRCLGAMYSVDISLGYIYLPKEYQEEFARLEELKKKEISKLQELENSKQKVKNVTKKAKANDIRDINAKQSLLLKTYSEEPGRILPSILTDSFEEVKNYGSQGLDMFAIIFNTLAVVEDYHNILSKNQEISEKDKLTLAYRMLWLTDSIFTIKKGCYEAEARAMLNNFKKSGLKKGFRTKSVLDKLKTGNLYKAWWNTKYISESSGTRYALQRAVFSNIVGNVSLILASIFETYQIIKYDFMEAKGQGRIINLIKAGSTAMQSFSGLAQLLSFGGLAIPIWATAGIAIVAGLIYAMCTAYLNFIRDDDVSDWLIRTPWVHDDYVDHDKFIFNYDEDGYQKALEAFARLKNKPTVYFQPTIAYKLSPYNVHLGYPLSRATGFWLMIDFPSELNQENVRIDVAWYSSDTDEFELIQVNERDDLYPDWINNRRPFSKWVSANSAYLPSTPLYQGEYADTWLETNTMNEVYRFWLKQPKNNVFDSILLLVCYPDDLNKDINVIDSVRPHCFDLKRIEKEIKVVGSVPEKVKAKVETYDSAFGDSLKEMCDSVVYKKVIKFIDNHHSSLILVGGE
ncbi:hypothetical protein [Photobacterium sp. 1_MG-2023]|uniref:hypothetical protein n=1 Tax=Photobacterium sp. 1_MG-2023 TaxID=3062646 RepID=UPI0026E2DAE2|nr:hypothetical protein [Photobacterium sp. 1_MG-2023]MDO6708656.1 hypothetical protein [Photobacterium sp. 1_MG-2023]